MLKCFNIEDHSVHYNKRISENLSRLWLTWVEPTSGDIFKDLHFDHTATVSKINSVKLVRVRNLNLNASIKDNKNDSCLSLLVWYGETIMK